MAHKDEGNCGAKHGGGEVDINPEIAELIWKRGTENSLDCANAHKIAAELDVPPADVGKTLDLMEWKITRCQLGLFGYENPSKRIKAAAELSVSRLEAACLCDALDLKIGRCQLGSF